MYYVLVVSQSRIVRLNSCTASDFSVSSFGKQGLLRVASGSPKISSWLLPFSSLLQSPLYPTPCSFLPSPFHRWQIQIGRLFLLLLLLFIYLHFNVADPFRCGVFVYAIHRIHNPFLIHPSIHPWHAYMHTYHIHIEDMNTSMDNTAVCVCKSLSD